jgi:uncharacterized repeat protein (TIGR01451 family)
MAMAQSPNNNLAVSVAFDDKSGNALFVYQNSAGSGATQTQLQYQTFNGTAWAAPVSFYTDTQPVVTTTLNSNPYSDQVMLMVNDHNMVLKADLWSGTSFATPIQLEANTHFNQGQPFTFSWDSFLPGTVTTQTTFTQTAAMTSPFVLPVGGAVTVTTYIQLTSGTLPASPDITTTLAYGSNRIVAIPAPPAVTPLGGGFFKLVWTGTLPNNVTIPTGGQIALTYTDFQTSYSFNILYGSQTDPSQVQVATATGITVNSLGVFNAPFPGGSPVTSTPAGQRAFVRFTVSDPFGKSDITSADVVIKNSSGGTVLSTTLTDANVVASTAGSKTYELAWTPPTGDTFSVTVTAHEGTEGVTATSQTTITATAAPDLVVTKSDGGVTVNAGGTVAYTIDYSNIGLALSTGVVLTEFLPAGSTFNPAASTPGWTALGTTAFTFAVGSLTPGASGSVVFAVNVPSPVPAGLRTVNNTVNIADDGRHGADTNPGNNSASDSTPINAGPDLVVTKTDGGVSTLPGGIVLYQITYSNIGTADDVAVLLTENLPANTTFNSTYSDPRWGPDGVGIFELSIASLPVGASGTVVFAVNVDSPLPAGVTQITNTVTISDSGASGPDLNPANNTSTDTTPIANNPEADLQITKTDNLTTVTPGQVVTYTITVTNAPIPNVAPTAVTGASFSDPVPASLSGVSYTSVVSGGATATPASGTGNNITGSLNLPVGGTVVYTVSGTLDPNAAAGTLTNIATVFPPAGITDPNTGNNTAIDQDSIVPVSDLAVNKSFTFTDLDHSGTLTPGDQIVFALTVTNNGPNTATGVSVLDLLPNGYQYVSDDARLNGGTYSQGTGLWTIGTIGATAPNNTAVLHITAIVGPGGTYTNTASINTSDSMDPVPGNNSSTLTPPVQPTSDLSLSKTMALTNDINGTGVISIGDQVTFTLTLNNLGPNAAPNVHVADHLPAGYAFVSATPSQGTYTSGTGDWNVGTVNVLSTQTLSIVATVVGNQPDSAYTNNAQASSSNFDPNTTNNSTSVTPFIADLSVTKTAALAPGGDLDGSGTLTVGDLVTFTVTVTNAGPDFATGVQLSDPLAAGFTYVSDNSGGTYDPTTGLWNVGVMAPGTTQTLTITASVNPTGPYTNTAQVTASQQFDPNSTPNNNVPTEDDQATVTLTPGAALTDLAVTKTVSNTTPNVGDTITFTVTLTNNGPSTATNVTVQDFLPTGLTFVSDTPSQGTYSSTTGLWTVGTVTTTTPQTLTIRAQVVSPEPRTNTAALSHLDQVDSDASNNSASVTTTPQQADLALAKTVSNATPNVGGTVTFTVTLSNNGPDPATNVTVQDLLPGELTFVSASPSEGTYNSTTGLWTVGTVNPGPFQTQTLTITATVTGHNAAMNTASVSHSDQFDPNSANNTASASTTPQQADLSLAKSVNNPSPNVGDTVTFTVALIDLGPNTATGVTVQDLLPASLTFVSATPSQGTYNSTTGAWAVGTIDPGHPQTLIITATVTSHNPATNTVTISHSDQFDPNPANNTASATVAPPQADLALAKTVTNATPNVGDTITFTVTLTNAGPDAATNVKVGDALPAGLTLVSATPSQGTYAGGVWAVGTVSPGAPLTLTLTATVVSSSAETNTATISHSDQFDPDLTNNTASATVTPQQADLRITKTVSNATPNVGGTVTFTVTLTNAGPNAATNVTVQDLLPAGLTFVSDTPSQGTYNSTTGAWVVGTVTTITPQTLTLTARVDSPNAQTNTATISHSDQFDPDPGNNQASVTATPQQADLALAKIVSNATPNVGDIITFTVSLTNNGPDAATNAQVTDLLPAGLVFVGDTPSQGTYNSTSGLWAVGAVANGAVATLQIQARVNSPAAQTNTATISHADQFDPDTGNNTASATATPQQADLAVGKSVSNPTPNVGDTIIYTIHVTNNGPDDATGVTVQDVLPAQVSFQSASATAGSYNPTTRSWTVGTVPNGTTQTLTIVALVVSPNPVANTASISQSDQFDPNPANNSDTASVVPQQADLQLGKVVSNATPNVGDTISFTVTLTNNGPSEATNVTVQDLLPAGLTFVSATPSQGTYNSTTGVWAVGTVTAITPQTLLLQAAVASPAAHTNTATITHSDQFDPDTGNNTASATATPQQADLALAKSVSNPTPNVGDTITFTVALTNLGPDAATNVTVQDLLPAGLTFVSATPSEGTYNSTTGAWAVGTVTTTTAQTLTIQATVVSPVAQTNTATISHSDQFDPDTANNTARVTSTPQQADLALAKTVSDATPNVGDTITFTVTLTNNGPDPATNVTVQDLLPSGLALVSATESQGAYDDATGLWTVGEVGTTASTTLTIQATVVSPAAQTNTATISHSDQFDPVPGNNAARVTATPQQADLLVTKSVSDPTPNVGDTITYTVTLTNAGPDPATGVTLQDTLPSDVAFVSAAPSQGAFDPATGVWTVGTVAVGAAEAQTLTITATVVNDEPGSNTASIRHADQFDPNPDNNSASASTNPQHADLALAKTVSDPRPNVGEAITFTVTLSNSGPNTATDVAVQDLLPPGLMFVSATPSEGTYDPATGAWAVGTVTTATPQTLTLTARVVSPDAGTNKAIITHSDQFDPNPGNNSSSATVTPQQADLAVAKTVSNPTPNVGDTITYTITLTNNGPDPATNVTVQDTLQPGVMFVSATPSQGSYSNTSGVWTVGTVNPGTPLTLTITATVTEPNPAVNRATIAHSDQFDPDTSNNSATAETNPQQADLQLGKTVSDATPNVGDTITFTVTLTDNGPNDATNVTVQDFLPAGLTFVSATPSQGTYNNTTGAWAVGTVTTITPQTLTIQATVASPNPQTNTATITHSDQFDPDTGNNSASATATPQQADLALAKTVTDATPNVGDTITFTVALTDLGPDAATNVTVQDLLPAGLTFVSATPSQGGYNSATGVWSVGTVTTTAAQTLVIRATVDSPNPQTNTATISHSDQFDPDTANNTASVTATPQQADLALAKTVSNATPNVGDVITYSIDLSNHGPDTATGVTVSDPIPAGLGFVSATTSAGSYNSGTGVWTVGTLDNGASAVLTIDVLVVSPAARTNTATITGADQFDPVPANNTASTTETPQQADLALAKAVSDATPNVGDTIAFTVTLANNGPDPATNVTVNDLLPSGLTFVTATPSQGEYSSASGTWVVGTVTPGTPETLRIEARVDSPDAQTNTATITGADQFDPNPANNTASATATPQQADLALAKTVSDATPNVGDTITFTVTLTNLGPGAASGVEVSDVLPAGLTFVSAVPSEGSYDPASGLWTVGTVTTATPQTLTIQATVASPDAQTNTATISHSDQFDPDPGNNQASVTATPQQADLALAKTVNDATPNVGETITYTVSLTNNGPDAATNVLVTDLLPAGLVFVSATASLGTYNGTTGLWVVGTVANGAVATLQIQATVNSPNSQTNTATISHANQFDPDPGNNTAGATTTPQQADLAVGKSVSNPTPNVGDTITFTIRVTNNGPDDATRVTVQDVLPAQVSFQSASATAGSYDPTTRTWTVGTVADGATETLTILALVVSPNPVANTASISHSDQFDPNPANNSDTASVNPQQADLQLGKTVSDPTPNVGDTITFTVTLTNNGPSEATNVTVQDFLPTGLTFVSATPSEGSYVAATGAWTVGTVTTAAAQTLTLTARVDSPAAQTNTATISHSDQFDPDTGNNTASATETPQRADLGLTKSVDNPRPNVGDTITFTITLIDLGPDAASGVTVQDLLPAGLSLLSFSPSRGTYTPATGVWDVGAVDPSAAQTLTLTALVVSAAAQTNSAVITHSDQFDPVTRNNSDSATVTPQQADLALAKTVSDATPNVGDTITFTVTVTNNGPDPATNVTVQDLLPAGLALVSATESQGAYDDATGLWTVGQVGTTAPATLTIQATVVSPAAQTNTATISHSDQFDPVPGNNTASVTATPQQADLLVTKSVSDPMPNVGDTITYTITLTNAGPDPATGVTLQDMLPSDVAFVSATPSQGAFDPATGVWTVGTVAVGVAQAQTLTITATVVNDEPGSNTASISHADQFDPNPENNSASASTNPQHADLALAKTVSDPRPNVGETITFTITLSNSGPNTATDVAVQDLLPAGLTFVSATPSEGTYDPATGAWAVGTVTTATAQTLTLTALVVSPEAQTNTATISHSDQFDPNPGNNSSSATVTPQQADLAVAKTVSNPTPNVGQTITYTITLTNNGPDLATGVTVQDLLPAGVSFDSATPSQGTYDHISGVWEVGTVNPGTPLTLTITANVTEPHPGSNTATISHSDQFDPDTANNSDTASVTPQQADLALAKIVSNATPNVGDTVTFTITLTNNGPNNATNVTVQDLLPAGLTVGLATPSQGTYNSMTGAWAIGTVTTTTPQTLTIQATVASPSAQTNTATISHADQSDPDLGNNSASATVTPQQADLALTKTVSDATPNVGDTVTFTVTLTDKGPDTATSVQVTDLLPAGLTLVSATPSAGTYNSTSGLWDVGTVTTTAAQTLTILATVASPAAQTNSATITHSDQFDPDTANNSASATTTPQQADLALDKSVSDRTPNVGDVIVYTVTLTNKGPDTATGVTIDDVLPAGLGFVSATSSVGSYSSLTGVWAVGTLADGGSAVLTLSARVVSAAAQTNTATISHSDQFDPTSGNNTANATTTPQQADLALAKSVNDATPNVGDMVTFTVTLTNNGPDPATNVTVQDLLPAGLTFLGATPSQGNYSGASGTWIVGTVTPGTPQTLQIEARVDSPAAQTNTATVSAADQFDPNTANNTASAAVTPQQADLALAKSVNNATPNVGDIITYTVTLTNNGPGAASGVTVSDPLTPGLSFVSFTASQGSYDSGTGLWTVGDIATGVPQTLQIDARVLSPNAQTNTAAISHSDQFDPNPGNNSASTTETPQKADLAVTKTVSNATPNVGDTVTFTVTLTNNGPDAATGVVVTDLLPGGLSFVSATPSLGTYNSSTGLWSVGTVPAATPETLTLQAKVVSPDPQTNTATISHADQFDPNPGNNSAGATETPQQADLAIAKSVSNPTPNVGDTITYTITLTDNGPDPATNVAVQDLLAAGVSFVSASATAGSYNPGTGVWTVPIVVVGAPQTLTITATVVSSNPAANTASISHSDQFDPNPANNSATASTNPQEADLAVGKTVSNPTPNVGDTITFTVTLTNSGPSAATGVQVTDLLPAGLTFVSATPSRGTYTNSTGLWNIGAVPNGGAAFLTLQALVVSPNSQTNTARVSRADQFDPNPGNNTASATETPQQADLAITKTVSNATPNVGDTITFIVTVRDLGPDTATNVAVNDLLPAGLSMVSATPSQGTYNSTTGVWAVGTVDLSAARTLTLTARVVSPAAETNTASISHADQFDPDTANNTASATATPQQADLALAKTVSDSTPNVGDTITYTVLLSNSGPDAATNVAVTDLLPAGLTFVTATPSLGKYNSGTGLWSVGTLAGGSNATLIIDAQVTSPAARTNTATITHSDQFDPDTANNTASTTERPQQADLALAKTVSDPTPNVGDTITFIVTLTDNGPDAATGVTVADPLPPGLTLLGATPSAGSYDPVTGVWSVGTVDPGTPQTLQFQAQVVSPAAQTNTATISHSDQFDPDAGNNQASATVTPQQADLAVTKTVSDPTPNVGDTITFTVTLTNNGPDAATNVQVSDLLPAGLTFVSATPSQGTYSSTTGLWAVGTMTTTAPQTLTFRATVDSPDAQTNSAAISHSDQFDPNPGNNSAAATETPQQADLLVTKSVSDPTPNVGQTITYTVTLTNNGPDAATNVTVQDTLPGGVSFDSATPSQGTYDHISGVWDVGTVNLGTPLTLTITANVTSPGATVNTATVSHSDQFDPNPNNNSASTTETPQQADLALGKTVSDPRPNVGDTITFTVTLINSGPNTATNVIVSDPLPAGLQFVSAMTSQGPYIRSTGLWALGTVMAGVPQTLEIQATVISPSAQTNVATITHSNQFDPNPNNNTASATETPQQADLALTKTVSDATPNVGDTITFTVTLADLGPDAASNVTVHDLLPIGLTLLSFNASRGTYTPGTGTWDVGAIDPSAAQTLTLTARVVSQNPQTNTAIISHADQFDPDTTNNTASATATPQQADLALAKAVSNPTPNVGDTITFTVTLTNRGPDAATNVAITDPLPTGLSFVTATSSQGNYDSTTGVWTVNTVSPSAAATLQIQVRVVSPDAQTNTATISHADQFDPDTGNNTASATETPQQADLALMKSVSDATPNVGDIITFTVTLSNSGPDSATNVAVDDLLPVGLAFVAATPSQGIYNSATGVWAVGSVAAGVPQTLQLQARVVSPSAQTNTATIRHSDQFDADTANNRDSATETPQQADLAVAKLVSDSTPNVGDTITFTVTLTNNGPDAATGVTLVDALPAGLTFVAATPNLGSYNSLTGLWTVGTVAAHASPTLQIEARVDSPNPVTNTATISHADQFDSNPGNNTASVTATPLVADLAVTKTVSNPTPNVGDTVTFTVSLSNLGPADDTGVLVTDPLPPGLSLVTATPSQGTYTAAGGLWDVGSLANGATVTLILTARVVSPLPRTNTATITHADHFDPNLGNNSAGATVAPQEADLALAKTVNNAQPNVGDTVTFTVSLTNLGPNTATNVSVADAFPSGLTLVSAAPSQGTYNSTTGVWTVGTFAASAAPTLTLTALVVSPSAETNTAAIIHSDQFDPDPGNNTASATVTPQQADLAVAKTVTNSTPNVGDIITFTVTLTNNGPSSATGVQVSDPLPADLVIVSATTSQGTYSTGTGVWEVGTLADGAQATLALQAQVISRTPQTNTATISHADQFDPNTGNNTASVTVIPPEEPFVPPSLIGKIGLLGSSFATALADAVFVNHLYQDLLGRAPDLDGLNHWWGLLLAGVPRTFVVQSIWQSPEHFGIEVEHFYEVYLHRPAEPAGLQNGVSALLRGMGETTFIQGLITSAEYNALHPDNAGFVTSLYYAVLGRTPGGGEVAAWQQALQNGVSRATVAQDFLASPERDLRLIDAYYESYLGRPPDPVGAQDWLGALEEGVLTPAAVGQAILASDEYFSRPM